MSAADAILLALHAATGDQLGDSRFREAEIVVLAWQHDKARFGLFGRKADCPDSKKVSTELVMMQPPRFARVGLAKRRGWMERVPRTGGPGQGPSLWRVTVAGLERVRQLRKGRAA